jgi:predicted dehydrogenase
MGMAHVQANTSDKPPVQLAVCDVHKGRLANALAKAGPPCKAYTDWREVIDRQDINVIHVPTPPHWHALISLAAVQAGKDVFCEKPFTRTIYEGQKLVEAVARYGRILQVNVHGRRSHNGEWLKRAVEGQLLGWPLTVRVQKVGMQVGNPHLKPTAPPPELDYEMWLGPAPWRPFCGVERNFRAYWDYDSGAMGDFGQHHFDPVQMALGKDDEFPVAVEASAPPQDSFAVGPWNWIRARYADGTTILFDGNEVCPGLDKDVVVQGPKGRFYLGEKGMLHSDPPDLVEKLRAISDRGEWMGFEQAVRKRYFGSGSKPNASAAHHSCTVVNMGTIAVRVGRPLRFDPATQRFINDDGANALIEQPMRRPWHM